MAAGSVQVDSTTGYPLVSTATGFPLVTGAGDACCCGTSLCSLCDAGTTPTTILLTLAGFSVTAGCITLGATASRRFNTFDINHAYCLPVCDIGGSFTGCGWGDVFTGRIDIDGWCSPASNVCAGAPTANFTKLGVFVYRDFFSRWTVQIAAGDGTTAGGCYYTASCNPSVGGNTLNFLVNAQKLAVVGSCLTEVTCDSFSGCSDVTFGTITITPDGC